MNIGEPQSDYTMIFFTAEQFKDYFFQKSVPTLFPRGN